MMQGFSFGVLSCMDATLGLIALTADDMAQGECVWGEGWGEDPPACWVVAGACVVGWGWCVASSACILWPGFVQRTWALAGCPSPCVCSLQVCSAPPC